MSITSHSFESFKNKVRTFGLLTISNHESFVNGTGLFVCSCGETFDKSIHNIKRTPHCPKCSILKRLETQIKKKWEKILRNNKQYLLVKSYINGYFLKLDSAYVQGSIQATIKKGNFNELSILDFLLGYGMDKTSNRLHPMYHFVCYHFFLESFVTLSENYTEARNHLKVICPNGHIIYKTWDHFNDGGIGCIECSPNKTLTQSEAEAEFLKLGQTLLSLYHNTGEPVLLKCPEGHHYLRSLDNARTLNGKCSHCSRTRMYFNYDFLVEYFRENDCELLIEYNIEITTSKQKVAYRCFCGKTCTTRLDHFLNGNRCGCRMGKPGEANPRWNPNRTWEERRKSRNSPEDNVFRIAVFSRDKYTCVCCKKKGGTLNVHHLKSWRSHKNLRYEVSNGVTLCTDCHHEFHQTFGYINFTEENFRTYVETKN